MQVIKYPQAEALESLLKRPVIDTTSLEASVQNILDGVKTGGQKAIKAYTKQFDLADVEEVCVSETEFALAERSLSDELKQAIRLAKKNIECFHRAQQEKTVITETMPGVSCWRKSVAIEKVGLYIPGGTAPLFSTILMLAVPAKLAGCTEIVLCTPPSKNARVDPAILYTARLTGISRVFKIGGVQAIASMAYGTEVVPKVYKIFGPGNQYVTCAKQLVNKQGTAIDMPAGPSEVAILADRSCVPAFVAADLLSQAEHGTDSQVILVCDEEPLMMAILNELKKQLELLPRKEIAAQALLNSKAFLVKQVQEGIALLNAYAPEHLILACNDADAVAEQIINAGSVFIGNYSCESAGDYASGTNHTLPTNGYAKAYSGVSLDSFVKKISYQKISREGLQVLGPAIALMAEAEGLQAHRRAVTIRLNSNS